MVIDEVLHYLKSMWIVQTRREKKYSTDHSCNWIYQNTIRFFSSLHFNNHFDQNIMLTFMTHDKEEREKKWAHAFELIEPSSTSSSSFSLECFKQKQFLFNSAGSDGFFPPFSRKKLTIHLMKWECFDLKTCFFWWSNNDRTPFFFLNARKFILTAWNGW